MASAMAVADAQVPLPSAVAIALEEANALPLPLAMAVAEAKAQAEPPLNNLRSKPATPTAAIRKKSTTDTVLILNKNELALKQTELTKNQINKEIKTTTAFLKLRNKSCNVSSVLPPYRKWS
eukprot:TRINITY_DN4490_c0_g1_i1.p2 TRINITY_DN4490_c0_g1~~TRINITY_DN4490_c0_g1_i1.p2  ORF type:complete len:135 (-),score=14.20 TRINITY_DN4490_c0_g1_i1:18-383(-)